MTNSDQTGGAIRLTTWGVSVTLLTILNREMCVGGRDNSHREAN